MSGQPCTHTAKHGTYAGAAGPCGYCKTCGATWRVAFGGAARRRHKLPEGECSTCDSERKAGSDFHPPHDASPRCESGGRDHCSCDTCF